VPTDLKILWYASVAWGVKYKWTQGDVFRVSEEKKWKNTYTTTLFFLDIWDIVKSFMVLLS